MFNNNNSNDCETQPPKIHSTVDTMLYSDTDEKDTDHKQVEATKGATKKTVVDDGLSRSEEVAGEQF